MFGSLLHKMSIKGSSVYGIELNLGGSNNRYWTLVHLTINSSREVKIIRQEYIGEVFNAEQLVSLNLKKSIPIVLCITGTGVLTGRLNDGDSISSLFPGLDENQTYPREYKASSFRYVSVVRTELLTKLVEQLISEGFFVWDVALGSLSVLSILSLLQIPKQEFQLGGYKIQLSPIAVEQAAVADEPSSFSERCFIGSEQTTAAMLPSLTAAISFFVSNSSTEENLLKNQQKEFKAFKKAKLIGYSFLGVLLIALLFNFVLYSTYTRQLEDLQLALSDKQRQDMHLNTLRKDLAEKQGILATMGIQRETPLSYITDRFAACIPKGIKLDRLDINPLADKVKDQKPILFTEGKLRVEGVCDNPDDFNLLLERLKREEWLVKVTKKEYRENELKGRFILELSYE